MGKECMARLSRRLWGGTSLKTAAKEATLEPAEPSASEANERDEVGDEDDEEGVLEYHFSDSVEDSEEQSIGINDNDEADDDVGDIPFLGREVNFLLRTVSRFGRTIRFNSRIMSYAIARIYLKD